MRVTDLLRHKGELIRSVDAHATVSEAVRLMTAHNIGALLIFDRQDASSGATDDVATLLGILSEREIMLGLAQHGAALLGAEIAKIMAVEVPFLDPTDSIQRAMSVMTHAKVRHLPVIEAGKVIGLISIGDVVKSRLDEKIVENATLRDMVRLSSVLAA